MMEGTSEIHKIKFSRKKEASNRYKDFNLKKDLNLKQFLLNLLDKCFYNDFTSSHTGGICFSTPKVVLLDPNTCYHQLLAFKHQMMINIIVFFPLEVFSYSSPSLLVFKGWLLQALVVKFEMKENLIQFQFL